MTEIASPNTKPRTLLLYGVMAGVSALVFAIDAITPHGFAEWVFYFIPVVLCILQPNPLLPYFFAFSGTVLVVAGFFASPPGLAPDVAIINRGFNVAGIFGVAYLVNRVIAERARVQTTLWLEQGRAIVSRSMLGEQGLRAMADNALHTLAKYIDAQVGMLYRLDNQVLIPAGSFGADPLPESGSVIPVGQGLAGEVARHGEISLVREVPPGYLRISSALGSSNPRNLIIVPIIADEQIMGVIELGFMRKSDDFGNELQLLHSVSERIGIGIRSVLHRQHLQALLEETQRQSEELQAQQEELRVTNEELQEQGKSLQESQALLETQQNELEQVNVQLEERTQLLERQKSELLRTQHKLETNAAELEQANRYKSEFLANMSHELRTPLNSSLILSHMLAENKSQTLTQEQVKYARTIHSANTDLLTLINDILDLSKIESGQVTVQPESVRITSVIDSLRQTFDPVAAQKNVVFKVAVSNDSPTEIITDEQRLLQIVKNLLSNAFKFTEQGEVTLLITANPDNRICFAVRDTGIGIPEHQQGVIFEAFRQADGSTSRAYGGTGLGLSISRELAHLLGGELRVQSSPGIGSLFTLEITRHLKVPHASSAEKAGVFLDKPEENPANLKTFITMPENHEAAAAASNPESTRPSIKDDRFERKYDRLILVVEDDEKFAAILHDLAHEMRFDCIHAPTGSVAVKLAHEFSPDAILLDVQLPDYSGLSVLERIKRDPATRHIPVHMMSVDDYKQTAMELGAIGYTLKPVAREEITHAIKKLEDKLALRVNRLLIVEDNVDLREGMVKMLGAATTEIVSVGTASEALEHLADATFDCMVMDLMLPDASGYEILEKMAKGGKYAFPPVIVYTGRALSRDEEHRLRRYSQSIIIKGAKSPERLLDEVSLFLHRIEASLPPEQQQTLLRARQRDAAFEGKRILVAEDDVRNIFALSSVFEPLGAELEITRNGKEALERLARPEEFDLVLMDLMMPEMDGLTAMREIRKQPQHKNLSIIALTAKAMPNDRKECLDAGANDYIAKPIDVDQLVSLCRVWMPK